MRLVFLFLCSTFLHRAVAQTNPVDPPVHSTQGQIPHDSTVLFTIKRIIISGNDKTKNAIILRELTFHLNDQYPLNEIVDRFRSSKKQLLNTGLFRNVVVSLKSLEGYDVYVNIETDEKWYLFPIPFLKPVDKNIHEWWTQGRELNRVNYGIKLAHNNFTGRNDKFNVRLMNGYTKQISFQYYGLFLDKKLQWSVNAGTEFGRNKEVNYTTLYDKQVRLKDNDFFLRSYSRSFTEISYRPAIKTKHSFGLAYVSESIADTIYKLNPYFSNRKNSIRYPELWYKLTYFDVDFIPYPTAGYAAEITVKRAGINSPINLWQLTAKGSASWPAGKKSFFNWRVVGTIKLPFDQPYITSQFIGSATQYLQGYEYYTIDGMLGGYTKLSFTKPIVNTFIRLPATKLKKISYIPVKLFAKTFINGGYVYHPNPGENFLSNKFLYSGGIGIDLLTFNDFIIKIEWSFNRLGENGLYLHRRDYF
jgi:outer membrane protein assembly factor BamA